MSVRYRTLLTLTLLMIAIRGNAAEPRRLTVDGQLKRDPVFVKSTGDRIVYSTLARPAQLQLMTLDLANGTAAPLHPSETRSEFEPAASADGRFLAFVQNRGNLSLALVIEDRQGDQSAEVPPGGGFSGMHSPTFTPDGKHILFSYPEEGRQNIYSVDSRGKQRQAVIDSIGVNNWPHVSPDGRWLAFSSSRDDDYEIYVAEINGANPRRLTNSRSQDLRPRFSPDGQRIAFTSNRDRNYEIYVMNVDGSNTVRVTADPELDDYPAWHPAGKQLLIVSERQGQFDLYLVDAP